ncbi:hypothetical protein [Sorangium sp. So ce1099]|uniref:hypothetical protein n=1 Tax=Sorangium sp. So ce1099 TaxID=3133331 RepID=UPI003F612C07
MRQTPTDSAIDCAALDPGALPPALVAQARLVWADRVRTELCGRMCAALGLRGVDAAAPPAPPEA